jgi:hypothetical protein
LNSKTNKHIVFIGFSGQKPKNTKQQPIKPIKNQKNIQNNSKYKTKQCVGNYGHLWWRWGA